MEEEHCNFQNSSKLAALVESHCQYLTSIRHNVSQRTEVARGNSRTLQEYMKDRKCKLNTERLLQLIVELAYFLYACKIYQVTPSINASQDLRVQETSFRNSEKRFAVTIWYKLEEAPMEQGEAMQDFVEIYNQVKRGLSNNLASPTSEREALQQESEEEQSLNTFDRQFAMLVDNKFFQEHETLFFLCLEQTALFYQQSLMYRIKNCSIMDFIRTDESKLGLLRVAKVKEESLVAEFNKEKRMGSDETILTVKEKEIENNITQFFRTINQKHFIELQSKNEKDQTYRVKFSFNIREREKYAFQEMFQSMQNANVFRNDSKRLMQCRRIPSEHEFYIDYSSEKNQICVRLFNLSLIANYDTSDFLIFQSNVFTFDSLNISIELTDPKAKGPEKSNKKVVTFKGTSAFETKEPPLERILLLMDVTMIASKIYEPQLMNRHAQAKDYHRLSTISKKITHYTKLFLKCAKKIYSE